MNRIGVYSRKLLLQFSSGLALIASGQVKNSCCFSYWELWKWNGMKCVCPPLWPKENMSI